MSFVYLLAFIFVTNKIPFFKKNNLVYFNAHMAIIFTAVSTYLLILMFFKNDFLELNTFFEFFFLYFYIYFIVNFISLKNTAFKVVKYNFFFNNYLYFILSFTTSNKFKNIKKNLNSIKKYHIVFLIIFAVFYFLKIYFWSTCLYKEYSFITRNLIILYNYNHTANIFYNIDFSCVQHEFIYSNVKFSNFYEMKIHYYKNYILNLNSFFIKILYPNENNFLLIYKNIFIFILLAQPFIFSNAFNKKIFIN